MTGQVRWGRRRVPERLVERKEEGGGSDSKTNLPASPSYLQTVNCVLSFTKVQLTSSQQKGGEALNGGTHGNKHHRIPRQSGWRREVVTGTFDSSVQFHLRGCFSALRKRSVFVDRLY